VVGVVSAGGPNFDGSLGPVDGAVVAAVSVAAMFCLAVISATRTREEMPQDFRSMISCAVKLAPAELFTKATIISSSTFSRESLRTSATTGELVPAVWPNATHGREHNPDIARNSHGLMILGYSTNGIFAMK
jgi:hypothetical protein